MNEVMYHSSSQTPDIHISESAASRMSEYLKTQNMCHAIRLSVKKTGCSGLSYVIDYVEAPELNDLIRTFIDGCVICIDKASYPYLKGLHIDYVKQGLGQKFVFKNPNQTGECGCGESFTVKDL